MQSIASVGRTWARETSHVVWGSNEIPAGIPSLKKNPGGGGGFRPMYPVATSDAASRKNVLEPVVVEVGTVGNLFVAGQGCHLTTGCTASPYFSMQTRNNQATDAQNPLQGLQKSYAPGNKRKVAVGEGQK